jgi:hypothetical protein
MRDLLGRFRARLNFSRHNKFLLEYYIIFLICIKSVDKISVLTNLDLFTELPPRVLLSRVVMLTDLKTFL